MNKGFFSDWDFNNWDWDFAKISGGKWDWDPPPFRTLILGSEESNKIYY
jgi:hypothetical protein